MRMGGRDARHAHPGGCLPRPPPGPDPADKSRVRRGRRARPPGPRPGAHGPHGAHRRAPVRVFSSSHSADRSRDSSERRLKVMLSPAGSVRRWRPAARNARAGRTKGRGRAPCSRRPPGARGPGLSPGPRVCRPRARGLRSAPLLCPPPVNRAARRRQGSHSAGSLPVARPDPPCGGPPRAQWLPKPGGREAGRPGLGAQDPARTSQGRTPRSSAARPQNTAARGWGTGRGMGWLRTRKMGRGGGAAAAGRGGPPGELVKTQSLVLQVALPGEGEARPPPKDQISSRKDPRG